MVKLAMFISFSLILINTFFLYRKKTPIQTLILVLLLIEFFLTSLISVIVDNAKLWEISKGGNNFVLFRIAEVVVFPILLLFYLEFYNTMNSIKSKGLLTAFSVLLLFSLEYLLIQLDVFHYKNWKIWWSFSTWFLLITMILLTQAFFHKVLKKEGVIQ
jgi:hypothetical protein